MSVQEPDSMEWRVRVNMSSDTPVVGVEIYPKVEVIKNPGFDNVPDHTLNVSWLVSSYIVPFFCFVFWVFLYFEKKG